jgi:hypothetical protein
VDGDFIMESSCIGARTALAKLFMEMATVKGHWYSLKKPALSEEMNTEITAIFPLLSSVLHLDARTMEKVLNHCGLCKEYGSITTPNEQKFILFIAEYKLDIQFTHFNINMKSPQYSRYCHQYYI